MNIFKAEAKKLRGSKILFPIILLPLFSVLFGTMNFAANQAILKDQWLSLWTQVYLFYGLFFLPALIGIVSSYLWRGEHRNKSFSSLLSSPQKLSTIIGAKALLGFLLVFLVQGLILVLYLIAGSFFHFTKPIPSQVFSYLLAASLSSISLIGFQSFLSQKIKSFAPPVAIALVFSFMGVLIFGKVMDGMNLGGVQYLFPMPSLTLSISHLPRKVMEEREILAMIGASFLQFLFFAYLQVGVLKRERKK